MRALGWIGPPLALVFLAFPAAVASASLEDAACDELRLRLEQVRGGEALRTASEVGAAPELIVLADRLLCEPGLQRFYLERDYALAWSLDEVAPHGVDSLLVAIGGAWDEGFLPEHYHLDAISTVLRKLQWAQRRDYDLDPRLLVDLDLLCSDAYLLLASHYLTGHVNSESIDPEWYTHAESDDLPELMRRSLAAGDIIGSLRRLLPVDPAYLRLKSALSRYRRIAQRGGWSTLPDGPALRKGARGEAVALLRTRLRREEDLAPYWGPVEGDRFDASLEAALKECQKRYGLDPDGVLGPATRAALNRPVESRIRQILVNLERWRWIPRELGDRYVLVNIADFSLGLYEDGRRVQELAVIVGQPFRRTPVFSSRMSAIVLNPYWEVPPKLAVEDKLPMIKRNRAYLRDQGFQVLLGWGASERVLDPDSLNWSRYSEDYFPLRLRQMPGPHNALGRIKFMFPNKFSIYLHDTPERGLFGAAVRTFSSGCIRVEHPLVLAEFLLAGDSRWPADSLRSIIAAGAERTIRLRRPVPVHLLYWTAWSGEDGRVQFRGDVYDRDWPLELALWRRPPVPSGRWMDADILGLGGP